MTVIQVVIESAAFIAGPSTIAHQPDELDIEKQDYGATHVGSLWIVM